MSSPSHTWGSLVRVLLLIPSNALSLHPTLWEASSTVSTFFAIVRASRTCLHSPLGRAYAWKTMQDSKVSSICIVTTHDLAPTWLCAPQQAQRTREPDAILLLGLLFLARNHMKSSLREETTDGAHMHNCEGTFPSQLPTTCITLPTRVHLLSLASSIVPLRFNAGSKDPESSDAQGLAT